MSEPSPSNPPFKRRRTSRLSAQTPSRSSSASDASSSSSTTATSIASTSSHKRTSHPPARLSNFLTWCEAQGLTIAPSLDLRYSGNDVEWSISVHSSSLIPTDTVIATIPKSAVLSRRTSALSPLLKGKWLSDSPETVGLELALCLLYERLLGPSSAFYPFLSILPRLPVPLPFLTDLPWLEGTEASRIDSRASYCYLSSSTSSSWNYSHDYGMCTPKALAYFHDIAIPVLKKSKLFDRTQREHLDALEDKFLTAYTVVSSRDFIVDAWHGVGLVPVADLFNHSEGHTVQFESDQEVCESCGEALLTGHEEEVCRFGGSEDDLEEQSDAEEGEGMEEAEGDEDGSEPSVNEQNDGEEEAVEEVDKSVTDSGLEDAAEEDEEDALDLEDYIDTLDMRTLTPHAAGSEMYNTYGPLPNALLLTRYGFCLDTETDFERYTVDLRFPSERRAFLSALLSSGFTHIAEVEKTFGKVLGLVAARFPIEVEEDEEAEARSVESTALDTLFNLDTLLPEQSWTSAALCPLFTKPSAIDEDLVDRDHIHPLFIDSTGRTSRVLFALTYLIHHLRLKPKSSLDSLSTIHQATKESALRTLHTFWNSRLDKLSITGRLEEALQHLSPDFPSPYIEKACIQHAYQEYAALKSALASNEDLLP